MQLYTTDFITGKNITTIGMVKGAAVQTKHVGKDFVASFKKIAGGEVSEYSQMLEESQAKATLNLINEAQRLGADAVVGIRYSIASLEGSSMTLAAGTAVKVV